MEKKADGVRLKRLPCHISEAHEMEKPTAGGYAYRLNKSRDSTNPEAKAKV